MISEIDSILLVEGYTNNVAIPVNTLVLVYPIESGHRLMRIADKSIIAAISLEISPLQVRYRSCLMIVSSLGQQKYPDCHTYGQSHNYVQKISTCQNNTELSHLESQ
jgi:hypothetical protein